MENDAQLICKKYDAEKILATKQASTKIARTAINAKSTSSNVPNAFFNEIIAATLVLHHGALHGLHSGIFQSFCS